MPRRDERGIFHRSHRGLGASSSSSRSLVRLVWMTVGLNGLMASITRSTVAERASRNTAALPPRAGCRSA